MNTITRGRGDKSDSRNKSSKLGVVTHAYPELGREKWVGDYYKFKANLVYVTSSRLPRATFQDPVLGVGRVEERQIFCENSKILSTKYK